MTLQWFSKRTGLNESLICESVNTGSAGSAKNNTLLRVVMMMMMMIIIKHLFLGVVIINHLF